VLAPFVWLDSWVPEGNPVTVAGIAVAALVICLSPV
jgi:hypothetical protein